jgi:hypothetical protein
LAETHHFTDNAGQSCGAGDREAIESSPAALEQTKALDGTGDTWNKVETRTIDSGNWTVKFSIDCGTGGGPQNRVRVQLGRFNSSCVLQGSLIIDEAVDVAKGDAKQEYTTTPQDPGQVAFSTGDILKVELSDDNGSQTKTVHYDGFAANQQTTVTHPDEASGPTPQDVGDATVSPTAAVKKKTSKTVGEATASPTGALGTVKKQFKTVGGGTASPTGVLGTELNPLVLQDVGDATVSPTGALAAVKKQFKTVGEGTASPVGALTPVKKQFQAVGGATVSPTGAVSRLRYNIIGSPIIQIDPSKYDPAASLFVDACLRTTVAGTARCRLWNITDSKEEGTVTTTSTTLVRVRSAALSLPTSAKEYRMEAGFDPGNGVEVNGARVWGEQ